MAHTKSRALTFARKVACAGLSAVVASTLALPCAWALGSDDALQAASAAETLVQASGAVTWTAPTEPVQVDGDVITVGSHNAATATAELLGLNGTVITTKQVDPADLAEASAANRLGVYGSAANQNPNPFLYNEFYNYYARENGLQASSDVVAHDSVGRLSSSFNEVAEEGWGVPADLVWRPDIVMGVNTSVGNVYTDVTLNHSTTSSINYSTWGTLPTIPSQPYQYILNIRRFTDDATLVGTRNSDGSPYAISPYYREGDNEYDPIAAVYDNGASNDYSGLDTHVDNVNNLAWAATRVLRLDSAKTTRYEDAPLVLAQRYEQYTKAIKWLVMKKIESGAVAKKSVAVVSGVTSASDGSPAFNVAKMNGEGDDTRIGSLRMLEAVQDTVDDLVAQYYPTRRAGSLRAADTLSAEQLMGADVIVCLPPSTSANASFGADTVKQALVDAGFAETDSAFPAIVDNTTPLGTFEGATAFNNSVESGLLVGLLQGFVYPEVVNPVDAMTYYASQLFHLKADCVEDFVRAELAQTSLPAGVSLDDAAYGSETVGAFQALLDEGTAYYYAHKASIDASRPRVASSDVLDDAQGYGTTTVKVTAPAGAVYSLVDWHGVPVIANADGTYTIDDDEATTLQLSCPGYRDLTKTVTGAQGDIVVEASDLVAARTVTFNLPEGASVAWVKDHNMSFVRANFDGSYTLDADDVATYSVQLDGYDNCEGTIGRGVTKVTLKASDFKPLSTATTINLPIGASVVVKDPDGATVRPSDDGTYRMTNGYVYTLVVTHPSYEKYKTTVEGGKSSTVNIRLSNMTPREGVTKLALNSAKVTSSGIAAVDAATVKTVTLGAKVKRIDAKAFANCPKLTKLVVKTKKLTKKTVKDALGDSNVKTVSVSVGSAAENKTYVAKYKKIFTKAVCGKAVTVK